MRFDVVRSAVLSSLTALALVAPSGCGQSERQTTSTGAAQSQSAVDRGTYLVTISGCQDCHTSKTTGPNGPEPDTSLMLAGHPEALKLPPSPKLAADNPWAVASTLTLTAWSGPWGVSFAANLTPDQNTGLGIWTEDMFIRALRTGKHMGTSRPILPPMPWQNFSAMTDDDLRAIFAYLRSIPPIVNHVPDPIAPSN